MPRLSTVLALLLVSSNVEAFAPFSSLTHSPSEAHRIFASDKRSASGCVAPVVIGSTCKCRSSPCVGGRLSASGPLFMASAEAATGDNDSKKGFVQRIKAIIPTKTERKKLIPLAVMFFCILFNYTILRDTKDVLMVTAPKSGAEVIPYIKTWLNLPIAILFTGVYAKMTDSMDQKTVFYSLVVSFLAFFATFALVIYPQRAVLHPHVLIDRLAALLPMNFAAPLAIIRNWSFAVFYVMAEMWGSVVASLLFWGLANEVTTVEEAKKYYPLFGLGANVALIFSGQYVRYVSMLRASLAPGVDAWAVSLRYLMGAVVGSGGVLLGAYAYIQSNVVGKVAPGATATKKPKKKVKMSMKESARFLLSSRYIRDLATLVIGILESQAEAGIPRSYVFRVQSGLLHLTGSSAANSYSSFMGNFSSATGAVTLIMMLLGRTIFQKFGWRIAAFVTPFMLGLTGLSFFATNLFSKSMEPVAALVKMTPLMLGVMLGAAQNILSKSSKYSLFDPCKEMAYIPLDQESKTKGKAAIDVIGNPLGKSGGALVQQVLIFGLGSLAAATPYLAVILAGLVFLWFKAANRLAYQFEDAMSASQEAS